MEMMRLLLLWAGLAVSLQGKPNILFIFADDQCHDSIAALGNAEVQTPHLDGLVREGTSFTNAYNMGAWNGAVCMASRTMILTGRTLWHAEALNNKEGVTGLDRKRRDLAATAQGGGIWNLLYGEMAYRGAAGENL